MSLGDGKAISVGRSGRTVVLSIADGRAFVNATERIKEPKYICPSADADQCFNFAFNIRNGKEINMLKFRPCEFFVENRVKVPIMQMMDFTQNQFKVGSIAPTFWSCSLDVTVKNDTHDNMLKYLLFRDETITNTTCHIMAYDAGVSTVTQTGNSYALSYSAKRRDKIMTVIEDNVMQPIMVRLKDEVRFITRDLDIMVENIVPNSFNAKLNIQPLYIPVEDYKPPDIGTITSGGSLKGFRLVIQKLSYLEQYLSFNDKTVKDITGLPQGMLYENGYLKGSPTIAGKFNINIKMDDNTSMPGLIVVTQVPREF